VRIASEPLRKKSGAEGRRFSSEERMDCYAALRRRRPMNPSPASDDPRSASDAGSGAGLRLIVRFALPAPFEVMMYSSIAVKVLVDVNESIKGPEVPMAVKVVWCKTGLQTSTAPALTRHVFSTTVQPAGSALAVNELAQLLRPSGLVMPVSLAKSQRVLAPEVCTSIVCESSVPEGCGGVPDIVAETFHDGPTLTFPKQLPLPEHIW
jgi:hypothetical protein